MAQLCLTLWDSVDRIPPGSSVHGILQARILEWVAILSSTGSFGPRDWIHVSCIGRRILYHWATWEALLVNIPSLKESLREEMHPYDDSIYVLPGCKVWVRKAGSSNQPTGLHFPQASVYHPPGPNPVCIQGNRGLSWRWATWVLISVYMPSNLGSPSEPSGCHFPESLSRRHRPLKLFPNQTSFESWAASITHLPFFPLFSPKMKYGIPSNWTLWEGTWEKEMATHSSVLAWRIPGTEEPGGLPSMGSQSRTWLKWLQQQQQQQQHIVEGQSDTHTLGNEETIKNSVRNPCWPHSSPWNIIRLGSGFSFTPHLPTPAPKQRHLFLLHTLQHPDLSSL